MMAQPFFSTTSSLSSSPTVKYFTTPIITGRIQSTSPPFPSPLFSVPPHYNLPPCGINLIGSLSLTRTNSFSFYTFLKILPSYLPLLNFFVAALLLQLFIVGALTSLQFVIIVRRHWRTATRYPINILANKLLLWVLQFLAAPILHQFPPKGVRDKIRCEQRRERPLIFAILYDNESVSQRQATIQKTTRKPPMTMTMMMMVIVSGRVAKLSCPGKSGL